MGVEATPNIKEGTYWSHKERTELGGPIRKVLITIPSTRFSFYKEPIYKEPIYKEPIYKEPTCRRPKYYRNLYY